MKAVFTHLTAGQPDLLSLKAIKAITHADMLIAPDVVQKELREFLPKGCMITRDLYAAAAMLAVRRPKEGFQLVSVSPGDAISTESLLKEVKFFKEAGFCTEIIPAVSGMQAVAAATRFPLTRRGVSHSFWVIDGKQVGSAARLFSKVKRAAASTATLVLLNTGRHKQELLALIDRERDGDLLACDPVQYDIGADRTGKGNQNRRGEPRGNGDLTIDLIIVGRKEPGATAPFPGKAGKLEFYGTL